MARKYVTGWQLESGNSRVPKKSREKDRGVKKDATQAVRPVGVRDMGNVSFGAVTA
jgi:hypothetical protein